MPDRQILEFSKIPATNAYLASRGPLTLAGGQWLNMTFAHAGSGGFVTLMKEYLWITLSGNSTLDVYADLRLGATGNLPTTVVPATNRDFRGPASSLAVTKADISAGTMTGGTLLGYKLPLTNRQLFEGIGLPLWFGPGQGTSFSFQAPAATIVTCLFGLYYAEKP